jgi:deoxyadenosine/deoxycytidine kinase
MGKIVEIIGNTASGKTTLTQALVQTGLFSSGLEQHKERPFQACMAANPLRYALSNQVDYLLLRAEQEKALRRSPKPGILDGGLEQDFFIFSRLFLEKGFLTQAEFSICQRLYQYLRDSLGSPDLVIWLDVSVETTKERYTQRERRLEIARAQDLDAIDKLLKLWLGKAFGLPLLVRLDGEMDMQALTRAALEIIVDHQIITSRTGKLKIKLMNELK